MMSPGSRPCLPYLARTALTLKSSIPTKTGTASACAVTFPSGSVMAVEKSSTS